VHRAHPPSPLPRPRISLFGPRGPLGGDLLFPLLRDDGPPRTPHGHRHRPDDGASRARAPRSIQPRLLRAGRDLGPLLALRGHRVDLPVPAALSHRETPEMSRQSTLDSRQTETEHVVPVRVYVGIFVALLVLTATTTAIAFVDLGPWNTVVALG